MPEIDVSRNERYIEIFKKLVDIYIATGEPVGSRVISKTLSNPLSPATIRNVMSDLEDLGILCSEHTSSGRKPTEKGWRFFVNALVEAADLSALEREAFLELTKNANGKSVESILETATDILSGLSNCVSIIMTPTINAKIKHIDFVLLNPGRAIVVIVSESGVVENRLIEVPLDVSQAILERATQYINSKLTGMTLDEIRNSIQDQVRCHEDGIDELTQEIVESGIEIIEAEDGGDVIVKGRSNLISNSGEIGDLRNLLQKLDEKKTIKNLLDRSLNGEGIQVFIGAETTSFEMFGCSMIAAPYGDGGAQNKKKLIGAIGVLGPSRMQYGRVITLVDYTAKLLGNLI
ncbi:MAG: heat-inducible transcriptional repressor HrcA [Holosporales bacterium]|jgi:heat-inducible transcriptional repressor|nr:heat-inducible transcriptional repressor HrcA [Holosporales bacterium]